MKEFELKYGCNPNQKPAKIFMEDGSDLPIEILCGRPGYINFQQLAAGKGNQGSTGYACGNLLQACKPYLCGSRHTHE